MNKKEWYGIFLICLISICLVFFFYKQKQGLFLDETYTYLFVGGNGFYYDGFVTDTWQDTNFYHNVLTIQDYERFNLKRVCNNNYVDVHPPLYFLLLTIFLSLFSVNNFSILSGIMFNLIFHIAIIIILYKLLKKMTSDRHLAFFITLMYAINIGTISNVLYIRMYELTTFWVVLNIYLHQKIIGLLHDSSNNSSQISSTCSLIAIVNFCSILTHYHYLILTIIITFFFNIFLLIKKEYHNLFIYDIKIIMSTLIAFIVFPNALTDIFHSNVGTVSIQNFFSSNILTKIYNFFLIFNDGLFANNFHSFELYLGLLTISIIFIKIIMKKETIFNFKVFQPLSKMPLFLIISACLICFLLFLAITIPYQSTRYIYIVYPLIIICLSLLLYYFLSIIFTSSQLKYILILSIYILTILIYIPSFPYGLSRNPELEYGIVDNLFLERKSYQQQLAKYRDSRALVLTFSDEDYGVGITWHTLYYLSDYLKFKQININYLDNFMQNSSLVNNYALQNDNLIVFLYGDYNNQEIEKYLLQVTKFSTIETIHENEYERSKIYVLHK